MENLHSDIKLDILSRLPIKSVLESKRVCKTWRALLGGNTNKVGILFSVKLHESSGIQLYYGDQHDINSIIDDVGKQQRSYKTFTRIDHGLAQQVSMIGSCNGLVCFFVLHHNVADPVYVRNPITGEQVNLPMLNIAETEKFHFQLLSGFGYIYSTNEYKVVRICYDIKQSFSVGKVQVYTLGGDGTVSTGWRNIGEINYSFRRPGIFTNKALHWLDYSGKCKIVAFNLVIEEFRLVPLPPFNFNDGRVELLLLSGDLCVSHTIQGKCMEIWAYKKNKKRKNCSYDMELEYHSYSWSKEFDIALEGSENGYYEPFAITKTNEVLLMYNWRILLCYDPKTSTLKKLWNKDSALIAVKAIPHMNSLVSPKALEEKSLV